MATDQGGQPRRPIEPLVGVVTDGVALGYQALELVVEGLRESLRIQTSAAQPQATGSGRPRATYRRPSKTYGQPAVTVGHDQAQPSPAPPPAGAGAGAAASSGALISDLAGIASELLTRAAAVAGEVASAAGTRSAQAAAGPSIPELIVEAPAGENATLEFQVWNTGSSALRTITLNATDLIGADRAAIDNAVSFKPPIVDQLGPGQYATVEIDVAVPKGTTPGNYRGLVQAEPGDTCAVVMLCVTDTGTAPGATTQAA
jgi:hypothetical protein